MIALSKEHGDQNTCQFIENLLNDESKPVALLINERYVNIPPPISVPLFQSVRYIYINYFSQCTQTFLTKKCFIV